MKSSLYLRVMLIVSWVCGLAMLTACQQSQRSAAEEPEARPETPSPPAEVARVEPPRPVARPRPRPKPAPKPEPDPIVVRLPAGTLINVELIDELSSGVNLPGDTFRSRVVEDVMYDGYVVVPAGSTVVGAVEEVASAKNKKIGGRASLLLSFEEINLGTGNVAINAWVTHKGKSETPKDAATIGGAAVLGAMRAISLLKLPLRVVGIVAAAQNMPDGEAYLPGDVVTSASGKTIEILNTDAEGRVVLADALHYASRFKPTAVIDLATLTGACVVALGSECCAVMGNDEKLIGKLRSAGERSHERAWPLPLWDEHRKQVKGAVGDVKNTAGRQAGTITAGAFLSYFVDDTPWVHLDIAGTAWTNKDQAYCVRGATGFGVRLLLELLREWK